MFSLVLIILSGVILPLSGCYLQKHSNNQLGDIYALGIGSAVCVGGSLSAALNIPIYVGALVVGVISTLLLGIVLDKDKQKLWTFGMLFGSFIGSIGTIAANNTTPENLQLYYRWAGATFDVGWDPIYWCSILILILGYIFAKYCFMDFKSQMQGWCFMVVAVISIVGIVGMLSLTIPNVVRLIAPKKNYTQQCVISAIMGTAILFVTYLITILFGDVLYLPISATMSILMFPLIVLCCK